MNAQSNPYGFLSVFDFHVAYIRPPFVIRPKIQSWKSSLEKFKIKFNFKLKFWKNFLKKIWFVRKQEKPS